MLYTSGTTGQPKGVMIPHRQIAWNAYNTVISWQLRQSDRVQVYTPMYHAGGLTVFLTPLFAIGGSIVLHDGFDVTEVLRACRDYEFTLLFGVPTIFKMLLDSPEFTGLDCSHLRWCGSGGAPHMWPSQAEFTDLIGCDLITLGIEELPSVNIIGLPIEPDLRRESSSLMAKQFRPTSVRP